MSQMVKELPETQSLWALSWQAALTPDPMMIPGEDIFLSDAAPQSSSREISLTANVANRPGLLFDTAEMLFERIAATHNVQPKVVKKMAKKRVPQARNKACVAAKK